MKPSYPIKIEKQMQEMFNRLSEKDKRLYAGVEALKFSYGGISYIAQLFVCSRNTILRGIIERTGWEGNYSQKTRQKRGWWSKTSYENANGY
jgi:hypothetical protein